MLSVSGDGPAEAAAVDVADREVLVETAPPLLGRGLGLTRHAARSSSRRSRAPAPARRRARRSSPRRARRRPGRPPRRARTRRRSPAHAAARPRRARTPRGSARSGPGCTSALPRKPSERPTTQSRVEPVEVADVHPDTVDRAAETGDGGVDDERRPGEEDLVPVVPRLEPELRARDRSRRASAPERSRARRSRTPRAGPTAVSTIATIGRSTRSDTAATRCGGRLRQDDPVGRRRRDGGEVRVVPLRPDAVDANEPGRVRLGLRDEPGRQVARRRLLGRRDRVLEVGDDRVGTRLERPHELPLLAARGEQEGAGGLKRGHRFGRVANV